MSAHYSVSNNALITTGRLLLSLLFIPAGLDKVIHYKETIDYVASAGLPLAEVTTSFAAAIEILAGIALLLGFHARIAAFTLAAFTLVASLFFHAYWGVAPEQQLVTQLLFFKNIAIIGGLLSVAAHSASDWSLDHYFGQRHSRDAHQSLNEEKQQPEPLTPGQ